MVSGRLGGSRQRKRVKQRKWRRAEASPVTICSLVESINPAICVMHTVLLLPPHHRSSVLTHTHTDQRTRTGSQTDGTHLMSSTPLSPICLCLFLCSSHSCAHKHCCHRDRPKQTRKYTPEVEHIGARRGGTHLPFSSHSSHPLFNIASPFLFIVSVPPRHIFPLRGSTLLSSSTSETFL